VLLNGLIVAGCDIVMLQRNRDLEESGEDFTQDRSRELKTFLD
jgi:hypothetical protein